MRSARGSPTTRWRRRTITTICIERMRARALPMICANPDVVVERGDKLVYCAGAIADLYAAAGGDVTYAGKPYRPIYEQALAIAEAARGRPVEHHRVLAIGDSVRTDIKGAEAFGIDSLFVTAGIHAEELGARNNPDTSALVGHFRGRRRRSEGGHAPAELVAGAVSLNKADGLAMTGRTVIKLGHHP